MARSSEAVRKTKETEIDIRLAIEGIGKGDISTGIPFLEHMLTLFCVHGFFDLTITAKGDLDVDYHHTVEDIGLVLGDVFSRALGDRKGIKRYGHAVTPMDDALSAVTVDLSNRPFLVYNVANAKGTGAHFDISLAKEFFRAFANRCGMNLHINLLYGENEHHILESIFNATSRALDQASSIDERISGVRSSKGSF